MVPVVIVLVVLALVAVVASFVLIGGGDDDGDERADRVEATTTTAPTTTTTEPRVTDVGLLFGYCDAPGTAWPEVPPHRAGEPDRSQVRVVGRDPGNGSDDTEATPLGARADGGSTVISPTTDGRFTSEPSVLERTRTVTCVTLEETIATGVPCQYEAILGSSLDRTSYELVRTRWKLTVYELHSGGILHAGEIQTSTEQCPSQIRPQPGDTQVAYSLTDSDLLAWFGTHFQGGEPA